MRERFIAARVMQREENVSSAHFNCFDFDFDFDDKLAQTWK